MYRSLKESKNISTVKIQDDLLFKYLTLTNPVDSKCIYTLHDLHLKIKNNSVLKLLSTDDLELPSSSKEINTLQIAQELSIRPDMAHMELDTIESSGNLLENNYAILLPGGSLVIETENTISEVALSIDWSVEKSDRSHVVL